ncbi:MAG: hypothetical protein AAGD25_13200 [Cyanobacteria bacterium P01_F01_bin.150]
MIKYAIKRKRLPQARRDQVYTLTIYMGYLENEGAHTREAKVQYPVISHREGLLKYRELRRMQRLLDAQEPIPLPPAPMVVQPSNSTRSVHNKTLKTSLPRRSGKGRPIPVAV